MSGAPGVGKINPELFRALEGMGLSAEVVQQLQKSARKTQAEEDFKRTLEKLWLSKSNEKRGTR
jgi:tripartite-type tricarboxylate transporter receptor subunit TctC